MKEVLSEIVVRVGTDNPESVPVKYYSDHDQLLAECRRVAKERCNIYTNLPHVVIAFQKLHALREIEVRVYHHQEDRARLYELDVKGEFILPWVDNFFEVTFGLLFWCKKEGAQ